MDSVAILKKGYQEKEGVYVPDRFIDGTVWDELSTNDLLDAATSATSEEHATQKGKAQIKQLEQEANAGVLLDLGCGYGRVAEQLLPRRRFEAYIGVDSSQNMLRLARARKKGRTGIETPMYFVYGSIEEIPITDASVDTVVVSAVFLHNHKSVTKKSIAEIHRILKPGGKLFVFGSFPNFWSLMGIQTSVYLFLLCVFGDPYRNGPIRHFGSREVQALLAAYPTVTLSPAGFSVLPKRILILPRSINTWYVRLVANPVNALCEAIFPQSIRNMCATHHDLVATK